MLFRPRQGRPCLLNFGFEDETPSPGAAAYGVCALKPPLPALMAAAALTLAGCGAGADGEVALSPAIEVLEAGAEEPVARYIEIEVADLATGLPCEVIDRPDGESRTVLWRAEFEEGFCLRKAEETRGILQNKGWACLQLDAEERPELMPATSTPPGESPHLVAAWRCVEGQEPIVRTISARPPVPSTRPEPPGRRSPSWADDRLRAVVQTDLASIGQKIVDDDTAVASALGDLNGDGKDDAIVIVTRDAYRDRPHRMLMAYLGNGDAYHLVDVWILDASPGRDDGGLTLAIEGGRVHLDSCCEDRQAPTVLMLADRKLAYAQEG